MSEVIELPAGVKVVVRGWLNCNQVLLPHDDGQVLIDSGYHSGADETLALLAAHSGNIVRLINTHGHTDHIGGNAAVAARYGCPITVPAREAAWLDPWDSQALWKGYADQFAPPFRFTDTISPRDEFRAADTTWRALAAPGHAMGALMFYCPERQLLVTGDALWENGLGAIMPHRGDNAELEAALDTLALIETLPPATVIPGHGRPFADMHAAVARARVRLLGFRLDAAKTARHFIKVMFVFSLLDKRAMAYADALATFARVPVYRDLNARFLGIPEAS